MKKRTFALLLAVAMMVSVLAGCTGGNDTASDPPSGESTPVEGGDGETLAEDQTIQLHWAAENFYSFDNNANYAAEEIQVQSHVLEGLLRPTTDEDGNQILAPAGAETYDVSDDGLVYTFHLREYYWSDGVQVTAQHFVDSFRRLGDPRNAFDFALFVGDIVGGTELYTMNVETSTDEEIDAAMENLAVKALDDTTLEVTLTAPSPQFLSKVAATFMYPVRLDVIEAAGDLYDTDYTTHVWCGPFIVTGFMKDNSITLEKNPDYWDADNVKLTQVDLINIGEVSTQNTMFQNGELAAIQPTGDYVQPYRDGEEEGGYTFVQTPAPGVSYFYFNRGGNSTSGLMESQKVRLALSLAINREEFTEVIFDRNYAAYGFVPYGVNNGDAVYRDDITEPLKATFDEYAMDNEKIRALFKEGMEELGDTRELSEVTITYICTGDTAIKRQQQEYWKAAWEEALGITVEVNVLGDSSLFQAEREAGNYDIGQAGWNGDYNDPMAFLDMWTSSGTSLRYSGWTEEKAAEFDALFNPLKTEADEAKREEIFAQCEQWVVLDEVAAIPYMYSDKIVCVHNNIKGMTFPFVGAAYDFSRAYVVAE